MEQEIILNDYLEGLYIVEDLKYMEEGLSDIISKFTPSVIKQITPQMFSIAASKNIVDFEKLIAKHGVKRRKVTEKDIKDLVTRFPEEVQSGAEYARKVIDNSLPKASKNMRYLASYFVTILAKIKHRNNPSLMGAVKAELKSFIPKVRSFYEEAEEKAAENKKRISTDDLTDVAIAVASVVAAAAIIGMVGVAVFLLVSSLASILSTMIWVVPAAAAAGIVIWFAGHIGR